MLPKIFLPVLVVCSASLAWSEFFEAGMKAYVHVVSISGVEAEVIKVAVERFEKEDTGVGIEEYKISVSRLNDTYVVLFRNHGVTSRKIPYISYDVEVSAATLKVIHSQFSR